MKQSYKVAKKSGSGTSNVRKLVWPFYNSLYFPADNVNPRGTIRNISTEVPSPESVPKKQNNKGLQESGLSSQEKALFSNQKTLMEKFLQSCNE